MVVKTHMIDGPVFARPSDGLRHAHDQMRENDIHHLPVVDDQHRVIGIISEHDVLVPRFLEREQRDREGLLVDDQTTVAQAMTKNPVTLRPGARLKDAVDLFLAHRFAALPVVDDEGKLVGMLTTKDLLLVLRDQLD